MSTLLLVIGVPLAMGAPPGPLLPTAYPASVRDLWRQQVQEEGGSAAAAELACEAVVEELLVCLRLESGGVRRLVTHQDLGDWGLGLAEEFQKIREEALENPLVRRQLSGTETWWTTEGLEGREAAIFFRPEWLAPVGEQPLVAIPARETVLAWNRDGGELDQIMAVGVRRFFDAAEHPVTPLVLAWQGGRWQTWGEARPPATE